MVEEAPNVGVHDPVHRLAPDANRECVQRVVLPRPGRNP